MGSSPATTGRIKRKLPADWLYKWGDAPERMQSMEALFEAVALCCHTSVDDVRQWDLAEVEIIIGEIMDSAGIAGNASSSGPSPDSSTASRSSSDTQIHGHSRPKWTPEPR